MVGEVPGLIPKMQFFPKSILLQMGVVIVRITTYVIFLVLRITTSNNEDHNKSMND